MSEHLVPVLDSTGIATILANVMNFGISEVDLFARDVFDSVVLVAALRGCPCGRIEDDRPFGHCRGRVCQKLKGNMRLTLPK